MNKLTLILLVAICAQIARLAAQGTSTARAKSNFTQQPSAPNGYYGPTALGPFSIDNKEGGVGFSKFSSTLGQTVALPGEYACYRNAEDIQLVVERGTDNAKLVRGVTLSRISLCPTNRIVQASGFARWATEKGIRLGSTAKEVLSKYGKPSSVWDVHAERGFSPYPREGDHSHMTNQESVLVYLPKEGAADTSHAFFGVRSGVVFWITLSDNE
jgi:hypothetical protein